MTLRIRSIIFPLVPHLMIGHDRSYDNERKTSFEFFLSCVGRFALFIRNTACDCSFLPPLQQFIFCSGPNDRCNILRNIY